MPLLCVVAAALAPALALAPAVAAEETAVQAWAVDVTADAGLADHGVGYRWGEAVFVESFAAGACWGDYDRDGWMDLYVTDILDAAGAGRSSLYRNTGLEDGVPRFVDVTDETGTGVVAVGQACVWGDYDSDGWSDLFVTTAVTNTSAQPNVLLHNRGGTFEDVAASAGIVETADAYDPAGCGVAVTTPQGERPACWSSSAAWIDHDLDGDLDLYVLQYAKFGWGTCIQPRQLDPSFCQAQPNRLYRNDDGHFVEVGETAGVAWNDQPSGGRSLGVIATDIDGDGWPDLWVANDLDGNALYLNNRDGSFRNAAADLGATNLGPVPHGPPAYRAGMGVDAADFDNDGDLDLLSTHLGGEYDGLWIWDGDRFRDQARQVGLGRVTAESHSRWGAALVDADLDGWKDLLLVTGSPGSAEPGPIHLLANRGGSFDSLGAEAWPWLIEDFANYRAAAFADVDNDGDLDLYASSLPDPDGRRSPKLLLMDAPGAADRHWLRLDLVGSGNARDAFGARIDIVTPDGLAQTYTKASGGSYGASHDPRVVVGLGTQTQATIAVTWPGGAVQHASVDLDGRRGAELTIVEDSDLAPADAARARQPTPAPGAGAAMALLAVAVALALTSRRLSSR